MSGSIIWNICFMPAISSSDKHSDITCISKSPLQKSTQKVIHLNFWSQIFMVQDHNSIEEITMTNNVVISFLWNPKHQVVNGNICTYPKSHFLELVHGWKLFHVTPNCSVERLVWSHAVNLNRMMAWRKTKTKLTNFNSISRILFI